METINDGETAWVAADWHSFEQASHRDPALESSCPGGQEGSHRARYGVLMTRAYRARLTQSTGQDSIVSTLSEKPQPREGMRLGDARRGDCVREDGR